MPEEKVIVRLDEGMSANKMLNLHISVMLLSFMSMVFHFTTVYFFTLQLQSLVLVGLFLGLGNLFSFFFDVPIGILQYYLKPRKLYILGIISQLVAMLIFGNFIFKVTNFLIQGQTDGIVESVLSFFLGDFMNLILMIFAAMCYGFTKEVNDVTTITYVLNNASPSQYKTIFARNNIFFGIGSFLGLLIAGVILAFSPKIIFFHILFILGMIFYIMTKFFDSEKQVIDVNKIEKFYLQRDKLSLENIGKQITQVVDKIDIKQTLTGVKFLIFKPVIQQEEKVSFQEMKIKTIESFRDIYATLRFSMNTHLIVYWAFTMLLTFGFWDTFASTFLIDYLNQVKNGWSYILLGIIAIPAYGLQDFFGKLSEKIGALKISLFGLILSGASLFIMSFFAGNKDMVLVMTLALINSVGYAICMSLAVANFLESYNIAYADRKNLSQIDANASAAPMKILQNLANVVGLFFGGFILGILGFGGFFFVFGLFILLFFAWVIKNKAKLI